MITNLFVVFLVVLAGPVSSSLFAAEKTGAGTRTVRARSLLQTWQKASSETTPVARVVNLLKEIEGTLNKEMEEDESLYNKLKCWCKDNAYEKGESIEASEAKISELNATVKSLTAKGSELKTEIQELETSVANDKEALAAATALREKEAQEFHGSHLDSTQDMENLKAAIEVLSKHFDSAFPQLSQGTSLLEVSSREQPWTEVHEASRASRSLDAFMRRNDLVETNQDTQDSSAPMQQRFLQQSSAGSSGEWSADETAVVRVALRKAASYAQAHHREAYFPSYTTRSSEIMGIMKQLQEEMGGELAEAQKLEQQRVAAFEELRTAKVAQIEKEEKMAEKKEDELAETDNALAHAKEDLAEEQAALEEAQTFLANVKASCSEADSNFDQRTKAREEEIKAVSETIAILVADKARDVFSETYSLLQVTSLRRSSERQGRARAATALRRVASVSGDPQFSALATSVELDAFTKVKKAIDGMIAKLSTQQEDEVKKNDWCKAELHSTEMATTKTEEKKADLEAKEASLESDIKTLTKGIEDASAQIELLQVNLQRATEDRQKENLEYQKTVADQTTTVEVLKMALERLAKYYTEADLLQQFTRGHLLNAPGFIQSAQSPPVPQAEYKPSDGASGVMQLLEKLIKEAGGMTAEAKKSEAAAQEAYEEIVANTNDSVAKLQKEVATKTKEKAMTTKEQLQAGSDIADTVNELEGLAKLTASLHLECDYLLKNFDLRQATRAEEIQSLQQAKQILSGAELS